MVLEYSKNYGIVLPEKMSLIKEKSFGETIVAFLEQS
jgi:16S rRNA G966 N2-methylase RsmD